MWINWAIIIALGLLTIFHRKLRISSIISGYLNIFYNDKNEIKRISVKDIFIIFISPLLISIFLVWRINIDIKLISELLTIISILSGLMFSLLPLIIGIKKSDNEKFNKVVKETFSAVSFEIVLGIVILLLLLLCGASTLILGKIMDNITLFLLFVYVATLLLILKRFVIIFEHNRENSNI